MERTICGGSARAAYWETHAHEHGGPGDHRYTESFAAGPAFGEPSDSLIRDIRRLGGDRLLRDQQPLAERLWNRWPQWGRADEQALKPLAVDLAQIRDELRREAAAKGREVE